MPASVHSSHSELERYDLQHIVKHNEDHDSFYRDLRDYPSSHLDGDFEYPDLHPMLHLQHSPLGAIHHPDFERDHWSTPTSSPPSFLPEREIYTTRSGLPIHRTPHASPDPTTRTPARTSAPPRKRIRKDRMKLDRSGKLDRPLSQMTKDWRAVTFDIETYVNRPAEQRQREIYEGKNPGKIKRPMNSFMLYRKAFQNRSKDWCLQNNHQVVSQVCGDSWPLEPDSVRDQFNEWARIERINHQAAHPNYKFTPSKPGTSRSGSKRKDSPATDDDSDGDDGEWRSRSRASKKSTKHSTPARNTSAPKSQTTRAAGRKAVSVASHDSWHDAASVEPEYHPSSYPANNGGRLATPFDPTSLPPGQYYQPYVRGHTPIPGVEDVFFQKTMAPRGSSSSYAMHFHNHDYATLDPYQLPGQGPIDPSLLQRHPIDRSGYATPPMDAFYYPSPHWEEQRAAWLQGHLVPAAHHAEVHPGAPHMHVDPALVDGRGTPGSYAHLGLKMEHDGWQVNSAFEGDHAGKWERT